MVDNGGSIGWAPASFLVPVDPEDLQSEAQENERLIAPERRECGVGVWVCVVWGGWGIIATGSISYDYNNFLLEQMVTLLLANEFAP